MSDNTRRNIRKAMLAKCVLAEHVITACVYCLTLTFLSLGATGDAWSAPQPGQKAIDRLQWQHEFQHPIQFQSLLGHDLLVVGTARHLYGIDPATGKTLWRKRNVNANAGDLTAVGYKSYMLVNDASGGAFSDRFTNVLALDRQSGDILWESNLIAGKVLQAQLDEASETAFVATVINAHGDDRGFLSGALPNKGFRSGFKQEPHISALDVSTGEVLWTQGFDEKVLLRPAYRPTLDDDAQWYYTRPFDLNLFHVPLVAGANLCVTYHGVRCYDAATGEMLWNKRFTVLNGDLALSYAAPVVHDGMLIATGSRRMRAFDLRSGQKRWRSRRFDIISKLFDPGGDLLFAQLGGRFFDIKKERWLWEGDFGVAAVDKNTGETHWKYTKVRGSITNLLILEHHIWLADAKWLICLNRYTGSVCLRERHRLKSGPVLIGLNSRNQLTLIGDSEAASFESVAGSRLWYVNYVQPGPGAWRRLSRSLVNASGNALRFGSYVVGHVGGLVPSLAVPVAGVKIKLLSGKKLVSKSSGQLGRQIAVDARPDEDATVENVTPERYQYFITQREGSKKHTLAVVNLATGQKEQEIPLNAKFPNIAIDEANGLVYEIDGKRLIALPISFSD